MVKDNPEDREHTPSSSLDSSLERERVRRRLARYFWSEGGEPETFWERFARRKQELEERQRQAGLADPEQTAMVFKRRARALRRSLREITVQGRMVALIRLSNEVYGIDLQSVIEFADLIDYVPIPCAPAFVLGITNLRGRILSVLDIREFLGVGLAETDHPKENGSQSNPASAGQADTRKIVVVEHNDLQVGILVDEVLDVVETDTSVLLPPPVGLEIEAEGLIEGEFLVEDRLVTLLNMPNLLQENRVVVRQEV